MLKKLLLALIGLLLGVVLLLFGTIWFGPFKISSLDMLLNAVRGTGIDSPAESVWRQRIKVPDGFTVSIYAADLPMARFMVLTSAGDLLVSRPRAGEVVQLERDRDGDGLPDGRRVVLSGLNRPHGLALHKGWIYIAESDAIGRVTFDQPSGEITGNYQRIVENLPDSGNHWSKTIGFGPDGQLYLSIGSSCNVCIEEDPKRATIMRFAPDGTGEYLFATGLRNSVGFDWAPWNGELYATDNGRDLLGDDFPPCELNRVVDSGFYGWPYINGFGELDPDLGQGKDQLQVEALQPEYGFRAHNAPLGITFIRNGSGFPARSALVALHGSWNRSTPDGYKVVLLSWDEQDAITSRDFLTGFEQDGDIIGRPVDVIESADGDIFVSDDYAGVIYRISHGSLPAEAAEVAVGRSHKEPLEGIEGDAIESLAGQGSVLYQLHNCASCHEGEAASSVPLDQWDQKYSWRDLVSLLETPTPPMPRFDLSPEQQQALAVYLLTR